MWLKKTDREEKEEAPEKLSYSRYYEHDGALRAYANRAMLLAFLCVPLALVAVAMAAYVRLQPPTVIRVDSRASASVIGQTRFAARSSLNVAQGAGAEPTDFETTGICAAVPGTLSELFVRQRQPQLGRRL